LRRSDCNIHSAEHPARIMTHPASTPQRADNGIGPGGSSPSPEPWLRTREGHRYGWELGFVIVIKLALLAVLWLVFIQPWPTRTTPPAIVVQQLYLPALPLQLDRHD
jgi:hypothetical protein